ncbi:Vitamin K-dependent gamma-carboxylase [Owenweeksia hongkongensis DSM 17368]|uniref:Vitamin K-dependent gamma-carboxylase n=1 Tax=Owenweeksia hongkongensis (strain DSM 17368 / CIP 108786 / JCM 12287 / NRRL B-23963 / UST20020801) TaxID=926562 RepID=G8QZB0_OWEHD|nr:HTTM domain-containing protein [Owenweeksia hongkongensis]AEV32538.1 Vitamin K-dependent gamma-carboxylase [Owenweeksia hongkongensis DSM 17368]
MKTKNIVQGRFLTTNSRLQTSLAPLAVFRIIFGLLMLFATIRFWIKGWIYDLYIAPQFHFKYYGFEWVHALPGNWMYVIFAIMALAAIGIALGFYYRISATLFFLTFTYVELLDVANYLNHYYFVSLISLIMIFLPAHRLSSLDVRYGRAPLTKEGNWWYVNIIRLQLAIVYFYAGVAKLNPDWLLEALPLKMWLPAQADMPLIGFLFDYEWVAYAFSWFGAFYDLTVPFFLWNKKTRPYAFLVVVVFHLLTWILFPIGVFPWVMIFSTLIFFSDDFHKKILHLLKPVFKNHQISTSPLKLPALLQGGFIVFICFQLIWPWRFLAYPGHLFWTEQGYRLSWRVMLMEKAGYAIYHITDPTTGNTGEVHPGDYLTPNQEKQLATQPDLILQFAHFLEKEYQEKGIEDPIITAEVYVTLNGQGSRLFIDPNTDLTKVNDSFAAKEWILPYEGRD